jgi:hypothetical protein
LLIAPKASRTREETIPSLPERTEKILKAADDLRDVAARSHDGVNESEEARLVSRGDAIRFPMRPTCSPMPAFDFGCSCYSAGQESRTRGPAAAHRELSIGLREEPVAVLEDPIGRQEAAKQIGKLVLSGAKERDVSPWEDTVLSVPTRVEAYRMDPATAAGSSNHRQRFSTVVSILSSRVRSLPSRPERSDRPPPQAGKRRRRDCPGPRPPSLPHG